MWYQIVQQRLCSNAGDDRLKLNPSQSLNFVATPFLSSIKISHKISFFKYSDFLLHYFLLIYFHWRVDVSFLSFVGKSLIHIIRLILFYYALACFLFYGYWFMYLIGSIDKWVWRIIVGIFQILSQGDQEVDRHRFLWTNV